MAKNKNKRSSKNKLEAHSIKDLEAAYNFQRKNTDWTFYNEREFIENLFVQRFNYLIVVFSLFITAAASVKSKENLTLVFSLGFIINFLISLAIYRAYVKLIILLKILHKLPNHVFKTIQKEIDALGKQGLFGVNRIMGIIMPIICTLVMILGAFFSAWDWLKPNP